jgi:toxin ParE1/3/4
VRIVWSPTARLRVQGAVDFIAEDSPPASRAWLEGLIDRVELLCEFPKQGRLVPEWGEESLREVFHDPYRVVYEIFEDRVEILTLSHVRQEFPDEPAGSS